MLTREEELTLIERWQRNGDRRAVDRLVAAFQRLVWKCARQFARHGQSLDDLVQEGNLALLEAARRFDVARGVRFSTYAIWWLRAQMQDYVTRNHSIVRLGSSPTARSMFFRLRHLQATAGPDPGTGIDLAAAALGVDRDAVAHMDAILRRGDFALSAPLPHSDGDWMEWLADDRPGPEAHVMAEESERQRTTSLQYALEKLSARERRILQARWFDESGQTLKSLGSALGVSTERVRQIELRALAKMRAMLADNGGAPDSMFDNLESFAPPLANPRTRSVAESV